MQESKQLWEMTWRGPKPTAENFAFISSTDALSHWGMRPSGSGSWESVRPNCLSNKPHCEHGQEVRLLPPNLMKASLHGIKVTHQCIQTKRAPWSEGIMLSTGLPSIRSIIFLEIICCQFHSLPLLKKWSSHNSILRKCSPSISKPHQKFGITMYSNVHGLLDCK